jgi:hypothetical protein
MYAKPVRGLLDPVDRVSEVLFGLIMVLTSTSTLSVATTGRAEIGTMIMGALGCNLAWGIIDAALYLLGCLDERGRNLLMLRAVRRTESPEEARRLMADECRGVAGVGLVAAKRVWWQKLLNSRSRRPAPA